MEKIRYHCNASDRGTIGILNPLPDKDILKYPTLELKDVTVF